MCVCVGVLACGVAASRGRSPAAGDRELEVWGPAGQGAGQEAQGRALQGAGREGGGSSQGQSVKEGPPPPWPCEALSACLCNELPSRGCCLPGWVGGGACLCVWQVFDISKVSMTEALRLYSNVSRPLTILCCGGDGTVSRLLEAVAETRWATPEPPRVAVLPLGTGNDLAKSLDWGEHVHDWTGGWTLLGPAEAATDSALLGVLEDVRRGLDRRMDRWEVRITPGSAVPSIEGGGAGSSSRPPLQSMSAYLGIGVDGKVGREGMGEWGGLMTTATGCSWLREGCGWGVGVVVMVSSTRWRWTSTGCARSARGCSCRPP